MARVLTLILIIFGVHQAFAASPFAWDARAIEAIFNDPAISKQYHGRILSIELVNNSTGEHRFRFTVDEPIPQIIQRPLPDGSFRSVTVDWKNETRSFEATAVWVLDNPDPRLPPGGPGKWRIRDVVSLPASCDSALEIESKKKS